MITQKIKTDVVVINSTPLTKGNYKIEFDASGELFSLVVHAEAVVDYRLVVGKKLDNKTFTKLQNSTDYQLAYSYAINLLTNRMYTKKELLEKLARKAVADQVADQVVEKLLEIALLDDTLYATTYITSQVATGNKSRWRLIQDLHKKGIAKEIIDELADLFSEELESALITKEIRRAYERYSRNGLGDFAVRDKVVLALGRKGFEFDAVKRQYEFFIQDLSM